MTTVEILKFQQLICKSILEKGVGQKIFMKRILRGEQIVLTKCFVDK